MGEKAGRELLLEEVDKEEGREDETGSPAEAAEETLGAILGDNAVPGLQHGRVLGPLNVALHARLDRV